MRPLRMVIIGGASFSVARKCAIGLRMVIIGGALFSVARKCAIGLE